MTFHDLFERDFGDFFVKRGFERVRPDRVGESPRGASETFRNDDFRVQLVAEVTPFGGYETRVSICPPSGSDNLGWLGAVRVLSHVAGLTTELSDLAATAAAMDMQYDAIKDFFREDEGYSDRWHLLQAFGNPKWVYVAPCWSDRA